MASRQLIPRHCLCRQPWRPFCRAFATEVAPAAAPVTKGKGGRHYDEKRAAYVAGTAALAKKASTGFTVEEALQIAQIGLQHEKGVELKMAFRPTRESKTIRGVLKLPYAPKEPVVLLLHPDGAQAKDMVALFEKKRLMEGHDMVMRPGEASAGLEAGTLHCDRILCHPACLKDVQRLARVLGPKGLMPTEKKGTVTTDFETAINAVRSGNLFRVDNAGIFSMGIGRTGWDRQRIAENIQAIVSAILPFKKKVVKTKGASFVKSTWLHASHGQAIRLNQEALGLQGTKK